MNAIVRIGFAAGLGCLCLVLNPAISWTSDSGIITDVKLSPDKKRIVIRTEGHLEGPAACKTSRPSRLTIDFKSADLVQRQAPLKFTNGPIKEIRSARTETGARLLVDFGDYEVPEYRISKIDGCFLVFLGDFKATRSGLRSAARSEEKAEKGGAFSPVQWEPVPAATGSGKLRIKTAEVVNDLIVLEVADGKNPAREYRISLGVDLRQHGFNTAEIRALPQRSNALEVTASRPARISKVEGRAQTKRGPGKSPYHAKESTSPAAPSSEDSRLGSVAEDRTVLDKLQSP